VHPRFDFKYYKGKPVQTNDGGVARIYLLRSKSGESVMRASQYNTTDAG
jgi:hypothetical protein